MKVCFCNTITEQELRNAALLCKGDVEAVYAFLGKEFYCRRCFGEASGLVADARARAGSSNN